jgi:hypothetical protein
MTICADLDELRRLEAAAPKFDSNLSALQTAEKLYAWLIANARADGNDESDVVEIFSRFSDATAPEVRAIASTLLRLGYTAAATRLREIAGRRKHDLLPIR